MDLFSGVLLGGLLGYGLDVFFGTKPFVFIVFLILGFCAGVRNVFKSMK